MAEDSVTTSTAAPTPSRRMRWIVAGGLVIAAGAVAAWVHLAGRQSTDDAQIDGHIAPIAAKVGGVVAVVRVKDNQQVKAGDSSSRSIRATSRWRSRRPRPTWPRRGRSRKAPGRACP